MNQIKKPVTTIGKIHFNQFNWPYSVVLQLSTHLDVTDPRGRDGRWLLGEFQYAYPDIRFLYSSRNMRPILEEITNGRLANQPLGRIVQTLQDMDRDDCVVIIRDAIVNQFNGRDEYEGRAEDLGINAILELDAKYLPRNGPGLINDLERPSQVIMKYVLPGLVIIAPLLIVLYVSRH
ncbi:uncharacterized protein LOC144452342 [Glandiceps talaboti]